MRGKEIHKGEGNKVPVLPESLCQAERAALRDKPEAALVLNFFSIWLMLSKNHFSFILDTLDS